MFKYELFVSILTSMNSCWNIYRKDLVTITQPSVNFHQYHIYPRTLKSPQSFSPGKILQRLLLYDF